MRPSRLLMTFAVGLGVGLAGQTLLFLERQCRRIETELRDDFRVLLLAPDSASEGQRRILAESLLAMPEIADLRTVSGAEALANLRREDPELVESVALVSDNPLPPSFEVKLDDAALGRFPEWLERVRALAEWGDIVYKPAQVQAILQAQFFSHLIALSLSALVCLGGAMLLGALWPSRARARGAAGARDWSGNLTALAISVTGAAAGICATSLIVLPMRLMTPWWAWPAPGAEAALLAVGAAAGWVLCARD